MSSYLLSALKENTIPPSEFESSNGILSQTLGKQSTYSTLGLRTRVEYENSSPRVWERILILLPPLEGWMYYTGFLVSPFSEIAQYKGQVFNAKLVGNLIVKVAVQSFFLLCI